MIWTIFKIFFFFFIFSLFGSIFFVCAFVVAAYIIYLLIKLGILIFDKIKEWVFK